MEYTRTRFWSRTLTHWKHQIPGQLQPSRYFSTKRPKTVLEDIKGMTVEPIRESDYLKTLKLQFTQNGRKRYRDVARVHASIMVVLYNRTRKVIVLVRQFRPAVFVCGAIPSTADNSIESLNSIDWSKVPLETGITLEIPGGIIDENMTAAEAIKQEVLEECGYDVPLSSFENIGEFRTSTGVSGDAQTMFYAECTDDMKVSEGGGKPTNGEFVEVVEMSVPDVRKFINQKVVNANCALLIGMQWFMYFKAGKI
ncbi:Uridine diphosphate glucose pyrophosphatase [Orchesella cincta]|uniref:Uridine diphosphate glucose pyrophosphatase NUDT14 n=1 Tax=Orchesella cincta TaxID=48709 RepID=A0A1D2MHG8_ORCCI|nr:Uridine diphosphate glucose pyrophosphatase [Orchesella cincta]